MAFIRRNSVVQQVSSAASHPPLRDPTLAVIATLLSGDLQNNFNLPSRRRWEVSPDLVFRGQSLLNPFLIP